MNAVLAATNLQTVDWLIVFALFASLVTVVAGTRKYMRGVADFLSAGRCGGRYVLCVSEGMAGMGAITLLAFWQMYSQGGFTSIWWNLPNWPLIYVLSLTGWVLYRIRRTRAMTMAQFLEMRYSKRFRICAGFLAFLSGLVNFGIFPGVNAMFFVYFCGLPKTVMLLGHDVATFPLVMACSLSISLFCTFCGGQIAIIVTDFLQGVFSQVVLITTCIVLLLTIGWDRIGEGLMTAVSGKSWINPFDIGKTEGFDLTYFLILYFWWFYSWKTWQGTQGYNSSAKTPHEARMSSIWGTWRYFAQEMLVPIFAICAVAVLHHPDFAGILHPAQKTLDGMADNPYMQSQMTVPLALSRIIPVGLMGALTALMMAASFGTEQAYLHSWGSIFAQDVVMPMRGKPLTPRAHIWLLRLSILGVAIFIFLFSLYYKPADFIRMYFAITGSIYVAWAGSCIVGGLYWNRGTTVGAWGSMIVGSNLAFWGLIVRLISQAKPSEGGILANLQGWLYQNQSVRWAIESIGQHDGQRMFVFAALAAIAVYVLLSLLTCREKFNLDRMLHRGAYAVKDDVVDGEVSRSGFWHMLGVGPEFSLWDKRVYIASLTWVFLWGGVFAVGTFWHLFVRPIPTDTWLSFWHFLVWMAIVLATIVVSILFIGGVGNLKEMFALLRDRERDHTDDGSVRATDRDSA
ncbi:MAG TPA: sodium:solute symporter [Phycisphaerae bacterium]|nr:sodium:solute symporter [Phycisphaerae bacterium]